MTPLRDNILVERIAAEKATASGIILKSTGEPDRAVVLAIGSKVDEVQIGEELLVNWNKAVKVEGENYILPIGDVICVYE
jgi:co-chaperonin GroES (HSP10)